MRCAYKSYHLPHHDDRPEGTVVDTVIVHCMYAPNQPLPFDPLRCMQILDSCRVSAHFFIARDGEIWEVVAPQKRAWHAGESRLPFPEDARAHVNDFSIGIELAGSPDEQFPPCQYEALARLMLEVLELYPIRYVLGHSHIAPNRKVDPGPHFDWRLLEQLVKAAALKSGASKQCERVQFWRS